MKLVECYPAERIETAERFSHLLRIEQAQRKTFSQKAKNSQSSNEVQSEHAVVGSEE